MLLMKSVLILAELQAYRLDLTMKLLLTVVKHSTHWCPWCSEEAHRDLQTAGFGLCWL